jgi:hypothetical protein
MQHSQATGCNESTKQREQLKALHGQRRRYRANEA